MDIMISFSLICVFVICVIVRKAMRNDFERENGPYERELERRRRQERDEKYTYPNLDEFNKRVEDVRKVLIEKTKPLFDSINYDILEPHQIKYIKTKFETVECVELFVNNYILRGRENYFFSDKRQYINYELLEKNDTEWYKMKLYNYLTDCIKNADENEKRIIQEREARRKFKQMFKN